MCLILVRMGIGTQMRFSFLMQWTPNIQKILYVNNCTSISMKMLIFIFKGGCGMLIFGKLVEFMFYLGTNVCSFRPKTPKRANYTIIAM